MLLSSAQNATGQEGNFPRLLKKWRHKRRLLQPDLALESGVSQRHVGFLESGRARPSRSMILRLPETLEVLLRYRNDWLIAAGFAPLFTVRSFDDPQIGQAMAVGGKNGGLGKKKETYESSKSQRIKLVAGVAGDLTNRLRIVEFQYKSV